MGSTDRGISGSLGGDLMGEEEFKAALADMGLTFNKPAHHHCQIREDGKVFVDWWLPKGTCIMYTGPQAEVKLEDVFSSKPPVNQLRGNCVDFEAMIAWLRSV